MVFMELIEGDNVFRIDRIPQPKKFLSVSQWEALYNKAVFYLERIWKDMGL